MILKILIVVQFACAVTLAGFGLADLWHDQHLHIPVRGLDGYPEPGNGLLHGDDLCFPEGHSGLAESLDFAGLPEFFDHDRDGAV